VDDSPIIRKVLGRALATLGMDTTMACDGMEGLELMQKFAYDFVLLDFLMQVILLSYLTLM
jgi:CheY-like chemotaxis protein